MFRELAEIIVNESGDAREEDDPYVTEEMVRETEVDLEGVFAQGWVWCAAIIGMAEAVRGRDEAQYADLRPYELANDVEELAPSLRKQFLQSLSETVCTLCGEDAPCYCAPCYDE